MSEIKVKTSLFKEAVTKAFKGSGRIDSLMLTSILGIEAKDGDIILTTTDNTNFLTVKIKNAVEDKTNNFYVSIDSELFTKLVTKTDSDFVTLKVENDALLFTGNGAYNMPLIIDPEEGSFVRIPTINFVDENSKKLKINVEDIKKIIQYNKGSVSKDLKNGVYVNYCIDNSKVYTYNDNTACITKVAINSDKLLLSQSLVNLLAVLDDKEITVSIDDNKVKFETTNVIVAGTLAEGAQDYSSESFDGLIDETYKSNSVKINKAFLLNTLDRIALFIDINDDGAIELSFSNEGLFIKNKNGSVCEKIAYLEKTISEPSIQLVDIGDIKNALTALSQEDIIISFRNEVGLYIEENGALQIVPKVEANTEDAYEENTSNENEEETPFEE